MSTKRAPRSKSGCFQCRRRKVRCDEQKPNCGACERLTLSCVFPEATPGMSNQPRLFKIVQTDPSKPKGRSSRSSTASRQMRPHRGGNSPQEPPPSHDTVNPEPPFEQPEVPVVFDDMTVPDNSGMLDLIGLQMQLDPLFESWDSFSDHAWFSDPSNTFTVHDLEGSTPYSNHIPTASTLKTDAPLGNLEAEDWESLQHYLSTMVKFSKIRGSSDDNVYCYIFTHMALSHPPLLNALLAWASLHLAHTKSLPTKASEARHDRALSLLYDDEHPLEHIDLYLVTIWLLLQFELLLAQRVDRFCQLLSFAADSVASLFRKYDTNSAAKLLGPVAIRVLTWLAAYDSRATFFGNAGKLLGCLMRYPSIYDLIHYSPHSELSKPLSEATPDPLSIGLKSVLTSSLRLTLVSGQIVLLGRWQSGGQDEGWRSVFSSIKTLAAEVEKNQSSVAVASLAVANGCLNAMGVVSEQEYNYLILLASYYAMLIRYHQHKPLYNLDEEADLPSADTCATRIIRIGQRVSVARPDSPQAVWPMTMFLAGMETKDPIYQYWVIQRFKQAEIWGPNLSKTRLLLEEVVKRQNKSSSRIDFVRVMDDMEDGCFVV